ncbi:MAG: DUF4870 domain-containing protein [Microbacteriaceae bacterium]|nr:DUF4870 domain-containing protein [Microbacteriaceae bacterium]
MTNPPLGDGRSPRDVPPSLYGQASPSGPPAPTGANLMWAHLLGLVGWLAVLIFWLVTREKHPAYDREGKEAMNLMLTVVVLAVGLGALSLIPFAVILTVPLLLAVAIGQVVFSIIAAVRTNSHGGYRYPIVVRMIP